MPELFDVACHFDDIDITDGYTGAALFAGQFSSFEESSPDGSTSKKRTLSVKPDVVIPTRRVISFLTETWIVGDGNVDGIFNTAIRRAFWMKKSSGIAQRVTPAQLLAGTTGYDLHISRDYLKDTVNGVSDTEYDPFWDIYVALGEVVSKGYFLKLAGSVYRVRGVHDEQSGFTLAQCDQLDSTALVTATLTTGTFDPITDTKTSSSTTLPGAMLEPSKFYRYNTKLDPKYNSGDMSLLLSTKVNVGNVLSISGMRWRVMAVQTELDAFAHHIQAL